MAAEVHQEGLQFFLELISNRQSVPSNFYIGLATDESLSENATLADITEVSGSGYARQAVPSNTTGFPTSQATGTNDWETTTQQVTFEASGTWTTARTAFLCTVASGTNGKLIASSPLSTPRTLQNGDKLYVTMTIQGIG